MEILQRIIDQTAWIFAQAAPYLLLGLLLAGVVGRLLSKEWVIRHLGGHSFWSVLKAALLGTPLPLCSCGVIPTTIGLRRAGAGRGACMSFLISTPETGVDSITITAFLINPLFTLARPVVAVISAAIGGLLAILLDRDVQPAAASAAESCHDHCAPAPEGKSCCAGSAKAKTESCCSAPQPREKPSSGGPLRAIRDIFAFGFGEVMGDIAPWILTGLVLAGVAGALIPPDFFHETVSSPWAQMGLMALVALPLYLCSTSTTPVAAMLLLKGLNPGAALVLLTLGPATNVTTMLVVRKEFGMRFLAIYQGTVLAVAFAAGALLNLVFAALGADGWWTRMRMGGGPGHEHGYSAWGIVAALVLCFLLVYHLFGKQWAKLARKGRSGPPSAPAA